MPSIDNFHISELKQPVLMRQCSIYYDDNDNKVCANIHTENEECSVEYYKNQELINMASSNKFGDKFGEVICPHGHKSLEECIAYEFFPS